MLRKSSTIVILMVLLETLGYAQDWVDPLNETNKSYDHDWKSVEDLIQKTM